MQRVEELLNRLDSAQYISTLDLAKGYWWVSLAERDLNKSALNIFDG